MPIMLDSLYYFWQMLFVKEKKVQVLDSWLEMKKSVDVTFGSGERIFTKKKKKKSLYSK